MAFGLISESTVSTFVIARGGEARGPELDIKDSSHSLIAKEHTRKSKYIYKMPLTEALYLDNGSLYTTTTQIISTLPLSSLTDDEKRLARNIPLEDTFAITTKSTVFYPQGGGQPSDTGVILPKPNDDVEDGHSNGVFEVLLVRKTPDGTILHFGRFTTGGSTVIPPPFPADLGVSLRINGPKRIYYSRLHTAGHILGLAMRLLLPTLGVKKNVKANHFPGEAALEYEGLLYNEHKLTIQEKVDEIVKMGLPVRITYWDEEEAERRREELDMVEGMELGGMGRVRIAEIGGLDACPCGGTHVDGTGEVGAVKIRKISRNKGVSKISYEVEELI
ncbi:Threonyl/alanyl tRNA synthetase [Aspergillus crustosus]